MSGKFTGNDEKVWDLVPTLRQPYLGVANPEMQIFFAIVKGLDMSEF